MFRVLGFDLGFGLGFGIYSFGIWFRVWLSVLGLGFWDVIQGFEFGV